MAYYSDKARFLDTQGQQVDYCGWDTKKAYKILQTFTGTVEITDGSTKSETIHHYVNGKLHNTKGPAIVSKNYIAYYENGKLHNTAGPAVIKTRYNKKYYEYFINDAPVTVEAHNLLVSLLKLKC